MTPKSFDSDHEVFKPKDNPQNEQNLKKCEDCQKYYMKLDEIKVGVLIN